MLLALCCYSSFLREGWSLWFRQQGPSACLDRPSTRRGCRTARAAPARPPASPGASAGRHTARPRSSRAPRPHLAQELHRQGLLPGKGREGVGPCTNRTPVISSTRTSIVQLAASSPSVDVPPPPVGRSAEHRRRRSGQVRGAPAVAEDEDELPGLRQVCDQAFQLAGGFADICDLLISAPHPASVPLLVGNTAPRRIDTRASARPGRRNVPLAGHASEHGWSSFACSRRGGIPGQATSRPTIGTAARRSS